jgi:AcrR family transcriptional regulator
MTSIRHNRESDGPTAPSPDDAYLDAAREAILAVGWSRTTLTDIARRAGVSRMTLYRRWPDSQTLLADLMTREWGHVVEMSSVEMTSVEMTRVEGADVATGGTDDALDRIAHGIVATVRALRANALLRRIVDVDPELLLPYLLDRRGRSQEMVADALAALIAQGQRERTIRRGDPVVLARSLVLACHGFTLSAHTMSDPTHPGGSRDADVTHLDAELDELVRRYLHS